MAFIRFSSDLDTADGFNSVLLSDEQGLPRFWATVWNIMKGNDLAESTQIKRLRYIDLLYRFCDENNGLGYLDDTLASLRINDLGSVLEAYCVAIKNKSAKAYFSQFQWEAGLSFVKDTVLFLNNTQSIEGFNLFESKIRRFDVLYGQINIKRSNQPDVLRSLPAPVVSWLYEILDPDSPENPFLRDRTRWTVYVVFILMLHQGLRIGEILLLPVDVVKSRFDNAIGEQRHWMSIIDDKKYRECDKRFNRPSIKTADSIRQIPVSELTVKLLQTYIENFRGRSNHPFLLNSQWNKPLSYDTVKAHFNKLSSRLPPFIMKTLFDRTGKNSITPHDLRHTSAVVRLNQLIDKGIDFDVALQKLRAFFGWSRTSEMPRRYAHAVFEDRLSNVWTKMIDDRIEILKSIPRSVDV